LYNEKVIEHYRHPRNVGSIEGADGVGIFVSDFCGDIVKLWINVVDGRITEIKFKTQGCAASIASGSVLTELAKGKTLEEAMAITEKDIVEALGGLPERKIHCSVLADDALRDAIYDYLKRHGLPIPQYLAHKHEEIQEQVRKLDEMGYILI